MDKATDSTITMLVAAENPPRKARNANPVCPRDSGREIMKKSGIILLAVQTPDQGHGEHEQINPGHRGPVRRRSRRRTNRRIPVRPVRHHRPGRPTHRPDPGCRRHPPDPDPHPAQPRPDHLTLPRLGGSHTAPPRGAAPFPAAIGVFRVSSCEGRLGRSPPRYCRPHLTRETLPKADPCSSPSTSD